MKLPAVANLIMLSVQAWTGDAVNLIGSFPPGPVNGFGGFLGALASSGSGPLAAWHRLEGIAVTILALAIAVLRFRSKARSVQVVGILGLLFTLFAAFGATASSF
jgi:uncharacterized membrane protein